MRTVRTRDLGISREVGEEVEWKGGALGRLGTGPRPQGGRPGGLSWCTPRPFSQTLGPSSAHASLCTLPVSPVSFVHLQKQRGGVPVGMWSR